LADLSADGWLGAEQFLTRPRETPQFRNLYKGCKLVEIHSIAEL
jgi:hypothetical protein